VPAPGQHFGPAVVERRAEGALTVRLSPTPAPALTIIVRPHDERPCFGHSRRIALTFVAHEGVTLTPREEAFLRLLVACSQAADP